MVYPSMPLLLITMGSIGDDFSNRPYKIDIYLKTLKIHSLYPNTIEF
jgi:hypothetical protein